jgi:glyoxylase-like metal-dependent hydrolase (beta-lactamase superfamily II)
MELFKQEKVSEHITRIKTPFGVSMFLVQGDRKALLIDTGMGIGDLKSFIEQTVTVPYEVVLTHGHCDHAGGASQFDEVYLNPADFALEKWHASREHRISDVFTGPFPVLEGITENNFVPQRTAPYTPLDPAMSFHLGDCTVSFIEVPGHTQGCLVPLIKEDGVMIIGDALGENTLMHFRESTTVQTYQRSIERLLEVQDDYSLLIRFHGAGASEHRILQDMHDLCDEIMNHTDAAVPGNMMGIPGKWGREKEHPGKAGNMIYNPERIFDEQEDKA